jgi:hypothetical protein
MSDAKLQDAELAKIRAQYTELARKVVEIGTMLTQVDLVGYTCHGGEHCHGGSNRTLDERINVASEPIATKR